MRVGHRCCDEDVNMRFMWMQQAYNSVSAFGSGLSGMLAVVYESPRRWRVFAGSIDYRKVGAVCFLLEGGRDPPVPLVVGHDNHA